MGDDHYDTVGVDKDADENEIRKAYKTKAQKSHPDKGGDVEKFQALQHAYDVLSDHDRRRRYDNGEDVGKRTTTLEEKAISTMMQLFAQQLEITNDSLDMVLAAKTGIEVRMNELLGQKSKAQAYVRKMHHLQKRMHYKGSGRDMFQALTEQRAQAAKDSIEKMTEEDKVLNRALVLVNEYECEVELMSTGVTTAGAAYPMYRLMP